MRRQPQATTRTRFVRTLVIAGTLGALAVQSILPASAATASEESCFVAAINAARSQSGVGPVGGSGTLLGIARSWSRTMANAGHIFHDTNLPNVVPSDWVAIGENVGVGPTCAAIAKAFMNSPEHRKNILDPAFSTVGIGVVDAAGGVMYVTEDFMGTGGAVAPVAAAPAIVPVTPMPALVAAAAPLAASIPTPVRAQSGLLGRVVTALDTFFSRAS